MSGSQELHRMLVEMSFRVTWMNREGRYKITDFYNFNIVILKLVLFQINSHVNDN